MANNKKNKELILEKNDFIEAVIEGYGYEGEGVARVEGIPVFIKQTIKGEKVRAKIIFARNDYCFGIVDKILNNADSRVEAPCPYYAKCGGCDLQHIEYKEQLNFKKESLLNTLKKQLKTDLIIDEVVPSNKQYNYRNKLSLPIRGKDCSLGFFAKNTHRLIQIDDCLLQSFDAKKLIALFKRFTSDFGIEGYDENNNDTLSKDRTKTVIKHLVVRDCDGTLIVSVVTNKPLKAELEAFGAMLKKEYGNNYALYNNINDKNTNVIFGGKFIFIGGNSEKIMFNNLKIIAHPAAFFQVNNYIAKCIYDNVIAEIKKSQNSNQVSTKPVIIDAYSGAGTLSVKFAEHAQKVYAIEINKEASEAAKQLAKDNKITNIECITGDCKTEVPLLCQKEKTDNKIIVLDPPKKGCDTEVTESVKNSNAPKIVYISCNPATLARDLNILSENYNIIRITPYDMFPQTANLETLVVLEHK